MNNQKITETPHTSELLKAGSFVHSQSRRVSKDVMLSLLAKCARKALEKNMAILLASLLSAPAKNRHAKGAKREHTQAFQYLTILSKDQLQIQSGSRCGLAIIFPPRGLFLLTMGWRLTNQSHHRHHCKYSTGIKYLISSKPACRD